MRIKNWAKFQHFKDRTPPWIKLYRTTLDDLEWHELEPLSAKVLVMLWLIASEDDGKLPDLKKLSFRLRMSETQASKCISNLSHWLEQDDIGVISQRYQDVPLETERETETEVEKRSPNGSRLPPDWVCPDDWIAFCQTERPDLDPKLTACRFADYWHGVPGQKGRKTDWAATWRNWVRGERKQSAPADVARVTTPARPGIDPALQRLLEDDKKAAKPPEAIRERLAALRVSTNTASTVRPAE